MCSAEVLKACKTSLSFLIHFCCTEAVWQSRGLVQSSKDMKLEAATNIGDVGGKQLDQTRWTEEPGH